MARKFAEAVCSDESCSRSSEQRSFLLGYYDATWDDPSEWWDEPECPECSAEAIVIRDDVVRRDFYYDG